VSTSERAAKKGITQIFKHEGPEGLTLYFFGPIGEVVKSIADFED